MSGKTAAIIGATGLTGSILLDLLLKDDYFRNIKLVVRRPVPKTDPRTEVKLVDFSDTESLHLALEGTDIIFCCIGTTAKKVKGDKALYRQIDFDIPVNAARLGKEAGCQTFVFMSSTGADSKSRSFYLQLKGETEEELKKTGIHSLVILRPSLLKGKRKEFRFGEKIAEVLMAPLSLFLPGRYKPVQAQQVAHTMLAASKQPEQGIFIYENKDIRKQQPV